MNGLMAVMDPVMGWRANEMKPLGEPRDGRTGVQNKMTTMLAPTKNRISQVAVGVASLKNGVVCMTYLNQLE
jgi:hypothetical protein